MAGLSFCLVSAEGAGLLFCPATIQPNTSVYSVFCAINASIPPTPQNSTQGFTGSFLAILPIPPHTIPNRHNKPLHSLRHAGAPTSVRTFCTDTRYHRRTGRCTAQRRPPIIIMYIRVHPPCYRSMPDGAAHRRPCQPGGVSMLPTPGISLALCFLPGTAARNHWRLSPQLFSGFRPIVNRGQQ